MTSLGSEGKFFIAFAGKSKHRIGADDYSSIDGPRQVNPNERQRRVRNWIDQMGDQSRSRLRQGVKLAAKRHDPVIDF